MKDQVAQKPLTTLAKVFLVLSALFSISSAFNFLANGHHLRDFMFAIGVPLISFGVYKNGLTARAYATRDSTFDRRAQYVADAGVVIVLAAVILRFAQ